MTDVWPMEVSKERDEPCRAREALPRGAIKGQNNDIWPRCQRCCGCHLEFIQCPNLIARARGWDVSKNVGMKCDYKDYRNNCECRGIGHLAADHAKAVAE